MCLKVQLHLGRILASVPKVSTELVLALMDHVPVPNVFERHEMRELVLPPGTNSWSCDDVHPGQTHGLRAELGWSLKADLGYGCWLAKTIVVPLGHAGDSVLPAG